MPMAYRILQQLTDGKLHSGQQLADVLHITRSAVWKHIEQLREWGLVINAQAGKGYQLLQPPELLDGAAIYSALTADTAKQLTRLTVLHEVDSTSNWVKQQPEPGAIAAIVEHQTGGRGRRGRHWQCPSMAGVLLSIHWPLSIGISALGLLSLQCGLCVARALQHTTGLDMQLKWPNDIVYQTEKIAGILVEINGTADSECELVIGVGINVHWPQTQLAQLRQSIRHQDSGAWLPTDCSAAVHPVSRNALAAGVLNELAAMLSRIESDTLNTQQVIAEWEQKSALIGHQLIARTAAGEYTGRACGVTSSGALQFKTASEILEFHGSDVSIRLLTSQAGVV